MCVIHVRGDTPSPRDQPYMTQPVLPGGVSLSVGGWTVRSCIQMQCSKSIWKLTWTNLQKGNLLFRIQWCTMTCILEMYMKISAVLSANLMYFFSLGKNTFTFVRMKKSNIHFCLLREHVFVSPQILASQRADDMIKLIQHVRSHTNAYISCSRAL